MNTQGIIENMGAAERAHTLRAIRERIGWTQQDAAERFGVNRRTIARWETPDGKSWVPDEVLTAIIERLRILRGLAFDFAGSWQARAELEEHGAVCLSTPSPREVSPTEYREAMAVRIMVADAVEARGGSVRWV
jgi:DNA-binding XRE family transcriptional regulator